MAQARIVVLDDDPTALELMGELLDHAGYQASVACPEKETLTRLRARPPALIIMDIYAPCHEPRWRLLMQLRSDPATRAIPILVTTTDTHWLAANDGALATLGLRALLKPFEINALFATLEALLAPGA